MSSASYETFLSLMGTPALRRLGQRQHVPLSKNTRDVFMLMAGHANSALRRDWVLDEIWADIEPVRASSALNTAIWRIKRVLNAYEGISVQNVDGMLKCEVCAPAAVDIELLSRALEQADAEPYGERLSPTVRAGLCRAAKACRGEFMDGLSSQWVLPLRERYHGLWVRALIHLMRDRAHHGAYDEALDYGRAILVADPFREATQRDVMRLYALNGQRAQAVLQYRRLKALLDKELGILPMPETVALIAALMSAEPAAGTPVMARETTAGPASDIFQI